MATILLVYSICVLDVSAAHRDSTSLNVVSRAEDPKQPPQLSAFDQFKVLKVTPQSDGELSRIKVFSNGKFCPQKAAGDPKGSCLLPDVHDDRTWFQFFYAASSNDSSIKKPIVSALKVNNSVIQPTLGDYQIDEGEGSGSFAIYYGCKRSGTARVRLVMNVTKSKSISMTWKKICGSGTNGFVSLTPIGLSDSGGKKAALESGPTQESTTVELGVKFPQTFIEFKKPYLVSSNEDVAVSLRGHVQSGSVSGMPKQFKIFYDCKSKTKSQITLTVGIPPWNNATLGWVKNCGGTAPSGLVVMSNKQAVYNQSGVASKFQVSDTTTLEAARSSGIFELDDNNSEMLFDIRNVGKTTFEVQGVGLTVSAPRVLAVVAESSNGVVFGQRRLMENKPLSIQSQQGTTLSLRCICLARGAAVVLVTLPIHGYKRVEFGFYKDCKKPHVIRHSGIFTTASSLLFIFSVLLIVGGVFGYRYYRNRTSGTAKYTLVRAVSS